MKAIMKNTVLVALMFTAAVGSANGPERTFGKKAFEVEKNLISIEKDPVFIKKGEKIFLNLLNLDQEKVTIKVYDGSGRVVFKETTEGKLVVEKAFNFEKAFEGSYTVVVVDNNETFRETIEVR